MEDTRDSAPLTHIVKIVRMVVRFHPLLTVTNLIFGLTFLQDWIEEEVTNQWKAFKVYCQSITIALLDPITRKMKNLSEALQMHLDNEAAKGQPKAKLIGKLALFSATFLLLDTELSSKYDKRGVKMQLMLFFGLDLLIFSKLWSQLGILRGRYGCAANSTSNFTFFILAIVFAKFYDNSIRSLSVVLFIAVFFLCLLLVLRPQTDLGFFSFIIGVIGSITYNCFEFKFPTWIITSICFVLFSFKSWLDQYWLDLEQNQSLNPTITTTRSTGVILIFSSGVRIASAIFAYSVVKSPLSDYKVWLVRAICSVICNFRRLHKLYPKDTSSPSTNTKRINGLILTIVNMAQGMFMFALYISPIGNYKDWLLTVVGFMIFCFWLRSFFLKDLSPPSTTIKGISSMILSSLSVAKYGILVLVGLESHLYGKDWLVAITCYVLWWVRLHTSLPRDLLLTAEFKATQWWTVVIYYTISDVISCMIQLSTTRH